jgi:membrane protein implicated in regulation of membrane protease activity
LASIRLFSARLSRRERRVYGALLAYFLVVFAAMLWPIYPFFSGAVPLIVGLPLSLFYLTTLLLLSFGVLLALYFWEARRGRLDPESDAETLPSSEAEPRGPGS